jgi:hypothetical protein
LRSNAMRSLVSIAAQGYKGGTALRNPAHD